MNVRFRSQYASLREVDGLSEGAFRLLVASWFWSEANGQDGVIRRGDLELVWHGRRGLAKLAAECTGRGAWHDARHPCESENCPAPVEKDGWVIHDYFAEMPRRAEAEACKAGKSEGGSEGNHRRWHRDRGIRKPGCPLCYPAVAASVSDRISDHSTESDTDSRASDFDFDLSQSRNFESSQNPDAREDDRISDRPLIDHLTAVAAQETGRIVTERQTLRAVAEIRRRAVKSATPVQDFRAYAEAVLRREPNLPALLGDDPASAGLHLAPPPDAHAYEPDPRPGMAACAVCQMPRANLKHREAS